VCCNGKEGSGGEGKREEVERGGNGDRAGRSMLKGIGGGGSEETAWGVECVGGRRSACAWGDVEGWG